MADDVLIASLALLATSWAGVTFATNGGANTAISNLLQSKPAVKLSLAGLMGTVAKITAAWVHAIFLYYSYVAILRWIKMVE